MVVIALLLSKYIICYVTNDDYIRGEECGILGYTVFVCMFLYSRFYGLPPPGILYVWTELNEQSLEQVLSLFGYLSMPSY